MRTLRHKPRLGRTSFTLALLPLNPPGFIYVFQNPFWNIFPSIFGSSAFSVLLTFYVRSLFCDLQHFRIAPWICSLIWGGSAGYHVFFFFFEGALEKRLIMWMSQALFTYQNDLWNGYFFFLIYWFRIGILPHFPRMGSFREPSGFNRFGLPWEIEGVNAGKILTLMYICMRRGGFLKYRRTGRWIMLREQSKSWSISFATKNRFSLFFSLNWE